jgi:hypothetical protein
MSKWATICKTKELEYIISTWCQIRIDRHMQARIIKKRREGYKEDARMQINYFGSSTSDIMDWIGVCGVPFVSQQSMEQSSTDHSLS